MERKYIYGVAQRLLHWWLAFSTIALAITGLLASDHEPDSSRAYLWALHILCGKILLVGLTGRLMWGLIGPKHARFSALIHIKTWIESVKTQKMLSADRDFGHHEQASVSYIGYYGLILIMAMTGFSLAAIKHGEGPLADYLLDEFYYQKITKQIHEFGWWLIAGFVVSHIGAMIFHEYRDQIPIVQSMFSGFQYRTEKLAVKRTDKGAKNEKSGKKDSK